MPRNPYLKKGYAGACFVSHLVFIAYSLYFYFVLSTVAQHTHLHMYLKSTSRVSARIITSSSLLCLRPSCMYCRLVCGIITVYVWPSSKPPTWLPLPLSVMRRIWKTHIFSDTDSLTGSPIAPNIYVPAPVALFVSRFFFVFQEPMTSLAKLSFGRRTGRHREEYMSSM